MSKQKDSPAGTDRFNLAGHGFVLVWDFMGQELGLKGSDLVVYARIFGFENAGKTFYESKGGTARFFGITERAVFDAVKRLKMRGLIEEIEPCEEALRIGSKCYRPTLEPLELAGIVLNTPEESAYEVPSPHEEHTDMPSSRHEEASCSSGSTHEKTSETAVQEVHPIPKNHNKHFE